MRKLSLFLAFILVLVSAQAFGQTCEVTIDNIAGSWNDGGTTYLKPGVVTTFNFRLNVACDVPGFGFNIANAYVISSPDGADWGFAQAIVDTLVWGKPDGSNGWKFGIQFLNHFNKTGGTGAWGMPQTVGAGNVGGNDSIAVLFAGSTMNPSAGMRGGYNGIPYWIQMQPAAGDTLKHICIDTVYCPGGQWKWPSVAITHASIIPAWYAAPQCFEIKKQPHEAPVIVSPLTIPALPHCATATFNFVAKHLDENLPAKPFTWTANIGTITPTGDTTATWSWNTLPQEGFPTLIVKVTDMAGAFDENTYELHVTNNGPVITCPTDIPTIMVGECKDVTVTATDDCDPLVWSFDQGSFLGTVTVNNGVFHVCPTGTTDEIFTIIAKVSDGLVEVTCPFQVHQIVGAPYAVKIEKIHEALQGHFWDVDITLTGVDANQGLGGFDLLIAYDNSALNFQLAGEGEIYAACGWEYFTYRFGANGNCGNGCPSGLTRIIGIAETNNGPHHPTADCPSVFPVTLAYLRFLVSNDRTFECQYAPIRFFWIDCGDNTLSNEAGSELYISAGVFDYYDGIDWPQINNGTFGFPTYLGTQDVCTTYALPGKPLPIKYVDFYNGGVDIACADSIDARGDINMNGLAYEIADAVMYTNYFIEGLSAFGAYVEGAIAASDVNADGLSLTVSDLVYLIRVVVGDAQPYDKAAPLDVNYGFENGTLSIDGEMGAAYLVFDGSVTPTLLANNMSMRVGERDNKTHVLVYSTEANQSFTGAFLQVNGNLESTEFATFTGQRVAAKNIPKTFSVQNYPNPFNPTTNIQFALPTGGAWTVNVYNVAGQLVWSKAGSSEAGIQTVEWNASNNASGVYFYKVTAGENSITKKAVLLK